ncbi:hypothetical protein CAEBREN_10211 [Caenorhabditis brenneri]|uniref:Uncharacterized protein n=1 Tax=Caenorhabditis brenneri TaxID=135651 RepID=G0NHL1_CAEBE|nr:hypothetical protein CAEBREN_10211 [Caenorhabditis brenneri]
MPTSPPRSPTPPSTPSTFPSSPSSPTTPPPTPPPMTREVQQILQNLFDKKEDSIQAARNYIFRHPEFTLTIKPIADLTERLQMRGIIVLGEEDEDDA